jgi:hypothetical protein
MRDVKRVRGKGTSASSPRQARGLSVSKAVEPRRCLSRYLTGTATNGKGGSPLRAFPASRADLKFSSIYPDKKGTGSAVAAVPVPVARRPLFDGDSRRSEGRQSPYAIINETHENNHD